MLKIRQQKPLFAEASKTLKNSSPRKFAQISLESGEKIRVNCVRDIISTPDASLNIAISQNKSLGHVLWIDRGWHADSVILTANNLPELFEAFSDYEAQTIVDAILRVSRSRGAMVIVDLIKKTTGLK